MAQLGVVIQTGETPPANSSPFSTSNAFMVGFADWGPSGLTGVNNTLSSNLAQAASIVGGPTGQGTQAQRTATNATLYDSADAFFREGGGTLYISRVLGSSPVRASLVAGPSSAVTFTAQYYGAGGNGISVQITNNTTTVTINLLDSAGNVLATSGALSTLPQIVSWAATTGIVTATTTGATLPSTLSATALSGGTDDRGTANLASYTTAINAFGTNLGPGQIFAPGVTNTSLSGIWSALLTHAQAFNRVAILDETDGASVATVNTDLSTAAIPSGLQGYGGVWAGSRLIPGLVGGTTRTVPPSPIIAGLCARVDQTGNPNLPPAGVNFPLQYATTASTQVSDPIDTYSSNDVNTLNGFGVNTFKRVSGLVQNRGFVTLIPPTTDGIYWQFNHARERMALVAMFGEVGERYYGSQADGQGSTITKLSGDLQNGLLQHYGAGALYGQNASDAFSINTGPSVNTPQLLQAGQLTAQVAVRLSPAIQLVWLSLNAVPITQTLTQAASPAQNQ